jgi:hypothetical protein
MIIQFQLQKEHTFSQFKITSFRNLGQNVLTGSLPPALGNLTRMRWMTFGINALSGPIPKEIGLLTDLRLL